MLLAAFDLIKWGIGMGMGNEREGGSLGRPSKVGLGQFWFLKNHNSDSLGVFIKYHVLPQNSPHEMKRN